MDRGPWSSPELHEHLTGAVGGEPEDRFEIDSAESGPHPGVVVTCALGEAGYRLVALLTRKAVHELELAAGCRAQAVFKAQACRLLASY